MQRKRTDGTEAKSENELTRSVCIFWMISASVRCSSDMFVVVSIEAATAYRKKKLTTI